MNAPKLSILICTLTARASLLAELMAVLQPQCVGQPVEVLTDEDNGEISIGTKRQHLLMRAQGEFVAYVDDDDLVSPTYVRDILEALARTPGATNCSLIGHLVQPGQQTLEFKHSTLYIEWATINGLYVRPPNHLNAVRRDLALQAGFTDVSWGEDKDYSMRLVNLQCLTVEAEVSNVLYIYRCRPRVQTPTAQRVRRGRVVFR